MGASVDGIISGIDTSSLIEALVDVYSIPKDNLETQVENLELRQEKITSLIDLLGDFEEALEAIESTADFQSAEASYEDTDAFELTVDGRAVEGTYEVEVASIATSEMEVSQGFASKTATGVLSTGTLQVTYAGEASSITIDADTSLSDLASELDAIEGLSAYVMNTGDASTPYRLVVQGTDTGADNTISFDTSGLTGPGTVPSFTESASAGDASLTVNGVTITSSTNTIDDAIPGFSFELRGETTAAVDVTIARDTDTVVENVAGLVEAFNAIIEFVEENSEYDADAGTRGAFVGDTSVQRVVQGLRTVMTGQFEDLGQDIDSLALVGVSTDAYTGTVELDLDTLAEALADDPDQVTNLFCGDGGFIGTMLERIDVYTDPIDGTLELRNDSLDSRIEDLEDQVERYEDRITRYEERLRQQFAGLESLLGTLTGTSDYLAAFLYGNTG